MDKKLAFGSAIVAASIVGIFLYRTSKNVSAQSDVIDNGVSSPSGPGQLMSTFSPAVNTYTPIIPQQSSTSNGSVNTAYVAPYIPAVTDSGPVPTIAVPKTTPLSTDPLETTINADFQLLFGRNAKPEGLAWWKDQVTSGKIDSGKLLGNIARGAQPADMEYETAHYGSTFKML